jgi:hypothetical protein
MAFNDWYDCEIVDLDSGGAIALDAEYTSLVIDFESREVAWREDTSTLPPAPPSTLHRHLPPPPSTTTLHHHAPPPPSTTTLHHHPPPSAGGAQGRCSRGKAAGGALAHTPSSFTLTLNPEPKPYP